MMILTIIQPYAELIASGKKRVENRNWFSPYRGPLAIHAGRAKRYCGEKVFDIAHQYEIDPSALSFGKIVAVAEMVDCVQLVNVDIRHYRQRTWRLPEWAEKKYPWMNEHEHTEGPFCFVLENIRRLKSPILFTGSLGMKPIDPGLIPQDAILGEST